jgi:hypothetical protein
MARISELHYSDAYAGGAGGTEFVEVALQPGEDPADFVIGLYNNNGTVGQEIRLTDVGVTSQVDPENGEIVYLLDGGVFGFTLTDPDNGVNTSYEGIALTNTTTNELVNFYDISGDGGTPDPQITALDGVAAATGPAGTIVSDQLVPPDGDPNLAGYTIQFNQPNPTTPSFIPVTRFDTGPACFVAGTDVMTPSGPVAVEHLRAGDLVLTRDHGPQLLRWSGKTTCAGTGRFAPVTFAAGRYGATRATRVSPQHRVLITGWQAELLFGEPEVLVPAKALVDDRFVQRTPCARVTYVHLLFDTHQIVESHGFWSESYFPVAQDHAGWDQATQDELHALFPTLGLDTAGDLARPCVPVQLGRLLR